MIQKRTRACIGVFASVIVAGCGALATAQDNSVQAEGIYYDGLVDGDVEGDFTLAILHDGRLVGQRFVLETLTVSVFTGTYGVEGSRLTGEIRGIDIAILFPAFFENRSISGTVVEQESLQLTTTDSDGAEVQISLKYSDINSRPSSLSFWEGTWAVIEDGVSTNTLTVDADGAFFGQDTDGCTATGNLSILDAARNLYGLETTVALCGEKNGDYTGFAYLDPLGGSEIQHGVLLAVTEDGRNFWGDTYSRPSAAPAASPPTSDDHGNDRSSATSVGAPSDTAGALTATDVDYFSIEVSGSGTLTVYTTGSTDTVGHLEDAGGNMVASNDDDADGSGLNFRIESEVSSGTYYVRVTEFAGAVGTYTLGVRFDDASTQGPTSQLSADGCTDGRYVKNPTGNPALVGDCRALVRLAEEIARNQKLADDHVLGQWGKGTQEVLASWRGIEVAGGRVTTIRLGNLRGAIPAEIGQLTGLTLLSLEGNKLTEIPQEIGRLTSLRILWLDDNWISDLAPLASLRNLRWLALDHNRISDLAPLAGLTNLLDLDLVDNRISDLVPLAGLTNLVQLDLRDNRISDLAPLAGLTNLTYLPLDGNRISDLAPLAGLTNLPRLILSDNLISDLAPLAGRTHLTSLSLGENRISDLVPLAGLTNLTRLDLDHNRISDLAPLAGLTNLTRLDLVNNRISDLAPLAGLTKLGGVLTLHGNPISDLAPLLANPGLGQGIQVFLTRNPLSHESRTEIVPALKDRGVHLIYYPHRANDASLAISSDEIATIMRLRNTSGSITDLTMLEHATSLAELVLNDNWIWDLSPLAGLTNLKELDLGHNRVSDLAPLTNLRSLTNLDLDGNQILDLAPLVGLTDLTGLHLYGNRISDLAPLAGLTNLTGLDLGDNWISDLVPLAGLTNLTGLDLDRNQILDLASLAGLTNLEVLDLDSNWISDLAPLAGLTNLTQLRLSGNGISDLAPLAGLTNLSELHLSGNGILDLAPLAGLTNLFELHLRDNRILDISPLVSNAGLGEGDGVDLEGNPLSQKSLAQHIPALQVRGVWVYFSQP